MRFTLPLATLRSLRALPHSMMARRVQTLRSGRSSDRPTPARPTCDRADVRPFLGRHRLPAALLAREVYDRVVAMKGEKQVALLTGEERIVPPQARYFLCTAEACRCRRRRAITTATSRDFAFAAIDEAQLGIDPERGHVFTDRMLRARGREETLILGSDTLKPIIRELLPEAEIVSRPRFSTLRYAGSVKLSRLPPRSAVVAFSAEQVYALAEMLRRFKGGAAVVMGALSPATRNAQVAMFQRGEVDYLVATDAIGMGLNMDVTHVAFAGLEKFDGRRDRRLTIAEMAQIAGRAGRHQKDGSFGTLGLGEEAAASARKRSTRSRSIASARSTRLLAQRRARLHRRPRADRSLERRATIPLLRARARSDRPRRAQAHRRGPGDRRQARKAQARRLWAVCGLPDFPQGRADAPCAHGPPPVQLHRRGRPRPARMVRRRGRAARQYERRHRGARRPPRRHPQLGLYRAPRRLAEAEPAKWAERTREVEARLSDALHERLTQRFVDRRTAVLVRDIGARGADALPVTVAADGEVSVGPEPIGHLTGFDFRVDPSARLADKRLLLAAAERRLGEELDRRAKALVEARTTPSSWSSRRAAGSPSAGRACPRPPRARPLAARAGAAHRRALDRLSAPTARASRAARALARRADRHRHLRAAQAARRGRDRSGQLARACARSRRCSPTPAACCRARRCWRHRPSRAGRPPGAAQAAASARPARRVPARLAEARGAALARGAARGAHRPADARAFRRRAPRRWRRSRPARRGARLPPPRPRVAPHRPRRPARQPCAQGPLGRRRRSGRPRLATSIGLDERRSPG
jgi:ATP-dependent RNA helicase SUPV3L1/SUV3